MAPQLNEKTTGSELVSAFAENINDKTILVTGASAGGIGALYAAAIAKANPALLILAARSASSVQPVMDDIAKEHSHVKTRFLAIDLASFQSVRNAATTVNDWADVPAINVLVNNAGIMAVPWSKTVDGYERHLATNHLGHFLFTNLVMPKLLASKSPRVVNISSNGHRVSPIRFFDYNFSDGAVYQRWLGYGQSKTANCLFALGLAHKLADKGLQAYSLSPGVYPSKLDREVDWSREGPALMAADAHMGNKFTQDSQFPFKTADEIIATHVLASFSDELKDSNGAYLENCHVGDQRKEEIYVWAKDPIEAERLWELSERLVGEKFEY